MINLRSRNLDNNLIRLKQIENDKISSNLGKIKMGKKNPLPSRMKNNICISSPIVLLERLSLKSLKSKPFNKAEVTILDKPESSDDKVTFKIEVDDESQKNSNKIYNETKIQSSSEKKFIKNNEKPIEHTVHEFLKNDQISDDDSSFRNKHVAFKQILHEQNSVSIDPGLIKNINTKTTNERSFNFKIKNNTIISDSIRELDQNYDDDIVTDIKYQIINEEDFSMEIEIKRSKDFELLEPIILINSDDINTNVTSNSSLIKEYSFFEEKIEEMRNNVLYLNSPKDIIINTENDDKRIKVNNDNVIINDIEFHDCKAEVKLKDDISITECSDNENNIYDTSSKSIADFVNDRIDQDPLIHLKESNVDKINDENSLFEINQESNQNISTYLDKAPELLYISDDSDDSITIVEDNSVIFNHSQNSPNQTVDNKNNHTLAMLEQTLLSTRENSDSINGHNYDQDFQIYSLNGKYPKNCLLDVPLECSKCGGIYKGKFEFQKHWYKCRATVNINSNIDLEMCNYKQIDKNRNINMKDDSQTNNELIPNKITPPAKKPKQSFPVSRSLVCIPNFIIMYCRKCGEKYDSISTTYTKECDHCNVKLMIHCKKCDKHYVTSFRVKKHFQGRCLQQEVIQCTMCDYIALYKSHLQHHISCKHLDINPEDFEPCSKMCGRSFKLRRSRIKHEKYCGKEANLFCKFCSFKTKHRSSIKMHMQQHVLNNEVVPFMDLDDDDIKIIGSKPKSLPKDAKDIMQLSFENSIRKSIDAFCFICKKSRIPDSNYMCDNCTMPMKYKCKKCDLEKNSYDRLRIHVIRNHNEKIYQCFKCARRYASTLDLNKHGKICGKQPYLQCNSCPFKTTYDRGLRLHIKRKHLNNFINLFSCEKCGKLFTIRETLRRHERYFCGVEPRFKCAHCEFRTRSKFSLTRHIQSIHSTLFANFQYCCKYCSKEFNNMFSFDHHVKQCINYLKTLQY